MSFCSIVHQVFRPSFQHVLARLGHPLGIDVVAEGVYAEVLGRGDHDPAVAAAQVVDTSVFT